MDTMRGTAAHLLPLRFFIAIGWLRAAAEKVVAGGWLDGSAVSSFIDDQIAADVVMSSGYQQVMEQLWHPLATGLGMLVLLLEILIGIALLTGAGFNTALAIGLFLNANFIAAGVINPSAFYMIIQVALLGSPAGNVLSIDGWLQKRYGRWTDDRWFRAGVVVWTLVAVWAFTNAEDLGPSAVNDPGAVLGFVAMIAASVSLVLAVQRRHGPRS